MSCSGMSEYSFQKLTGLTFNFQSIFHDRYGTPQSHVLFLGTFSENHNCRVMDSFSVGVTVIKPFIGITLQDFVWSGKYCSYRENDNIVFILFTFFSPLTRQHVICSIYILLPRNGLNAAVVWNSILNQDDTCFLSEGSLDVDYIIIS